MCQFRVKYARIPVRRLPLEGKKTSWLAGAAAEVDLALQLVIINVRASACSYLGIPALSPHTSRLLTFSTFWPEMCRLRVLRRPGFRRCRLGGLEKPCIYVRRGRALTQADLALPW